MSSVGKAEIKPTVSVRIICFFSGKLTKLILVSRVANTISFTKTSAFVKLLKIEDLPLLV